MDTTSVTLQSLVKHLQRRGSPLASESAFFVSLECAEAFQLAGHHAVTIANVRLDGEGLVSFVAAPHCAEDVAVRALGDIVQQICPTLAGASLALAKRISRGEVQTSADVRITLEAQLVPLNRGAARRVLARLVRDALKDPTPMGIDEAAADALDDSPRPVRPSAEQTMDGHDGLDDLGAKLALSVEPKSSTSTDSAVDTAPDAAVVVSAVQSSPDLTPLPSRLPPPPRLGSLSSMQIGTAPAPVDESSDADVSPDATQTVQDESEADLSPRIQRRQKSQGPALAASILLVVFAGLFFAWRLMHR